MARQGLNSRPNHGVPSPSDYGARGWATSTAARRVADYLRALGLRDRAYLEELSVGIARAVRGKDERDHVRRAVAEAQRRFEAWKHELYAVLPSDVSPLWLKQFIAAHPRLLLGNVKLAQATALRFGDPRTGRKPPRARFSTQHFEPAMLPRWLIGVTPALLVVALALCSLLSEFGRDGLSFVEGAWAALFSFLFFQLALGASTALLGFSGVRSAAALEPDSTLEASARPHSEAPDQALPKTALIMPVYHESAEEVFAALAAMREALSARPEARAFEVFVLSDSREPVLAAEEESAFRVVAAEQASVPIYYHRRAVNERQKAGNVAEFFESWGPRYTYVVVLDADSIMSADTLVALVRRMEREPRTALLQAPVALHGAETLFARALQFASSVCGPLFTRGLAAWSGPHGNYYGHNAVIRVEAFLACCALPKLKGNPPLGGDVLSHDFVEAALLCRADWEVKSAPELSSGSYEGVPPTLPEYIARDRRWCQGNLQHIALAATRGLRTMSRIHLLSGAAAYLASPAWFLLLGLGVVLWDQGVVFREFGPLLMAGTALLLVTPWLLGFITVAKDARARRLHGGFVRLLVSVLGSLLLGALIAPLLMLHHTRIVLSILTGSAVRWGAQRRRAASSFWTSVRLEGLTTLLGLGIAAALGFTGSALFAWLAPVWVPWALAIPIAVAVSSARLGLGLRRLGLFSVATEVEPEPLLERVEQLRTLTRADTALRYRDLVLDPVLIETHLARLEPGPSVASKLLAELRQRALCEGPASLSADEWRVLAEDAESMRRLHREAWQRWSVDSWGQAREREEVPSDSEPSELILGNPPERLSVPSQRASEPISLRASRARRRVGRSRSR